MRDRLKRGPTRNPRKRYQCVTCGLRLSGRMATDGRIYAYDRSPDENAGLEPELCVCLSCTERGVTVCAGPSGSVTDADAGRRTADTQNADG